MRFMKRPETGSGLAVGFCSRRVWVHKASSCHWCAVFQHSRPWLWKEEHQKNKTVVAEILHDDTPLGSNVQYNKSNSTYPYVCVLLWKSDSICTHTPLCCQEVSIRKVLAGPCYILHIRKEVRVVLMQVKVEELPWHMRTLNDKLGKILLSEDC